MILRIGPLAAAATLLAVIAGCSGDRAAPELVVERDTVGDTIVVRTVSGSHWGTDRYLEPEMRIGAFEGDDEYMLGDVAGLAAAPDGAVYVYDRQVPALRKYDEDGTYVATFGREGGGPGEYKQSDGGLAVLPDGRVLLRDPGNARINVYAPSGESLDHWELRGGYFTSRPLFVDTAGRVYTQIWGTSEDGERYDGLQAYDPDGARGDSVIAPEWDYEAPTLSASGESFRMMNSVPFSPSPQWTFSPHGQFVGGLSTRYAIELFEGDGSVLRMERDIDPVPVQADERANAEQRAIDNFRRMVPDWKWNGPSIPSHKPPFRAVVAGRDGRIYVQLWQPGQRIPDEELDESTDPEARTPERWREPVVYDVFEPDGTYLGQLRAPDRFRTHPQPVFDGDRVWAVVVDELDVEYLTRFRVVSERAEARTE